MADLPEPKRLKADNDEANGHADRPDEIPLLEFGNKRDNVEGEMEAQEGASEKKVEEHGTDDEESLAEPQAYFNKEEDVGIEQYLDKGHKGFFGILKQRYSDFHVHERTPTGTVVRLTDCHMAPELTTDEKTIALDALFSPEQIKKLQLLLESNDRDAYEDIEVGTDKDHRTKLHQAIRQYFPTLESKTLPQGIATAKMFIKVTKSGRGPRRPHWPRDRPDYCWFVLYKENRDTLDAINFLSSLLRIKASVFQYAGTKDKRAITSQAVTAFRVPAQRLLATNNASKNIQVGNFKYTEEPLKLGSLSGNHFTIVLRKVEGEDSVIDAAMASLRDMGFINYYGMQRFGTSTIPTHHIDVSIHKLLFSCLLHSNWEGAVDLILKPRPGEPQHIGEARQYYLDTKDAAGTLQRMPRRRCVETKLLMGLKERQGTNDIQGAFNYIPRNTRLMYVHSYQSYVWNKIASLRINYYGAAPVLGDLVWSNAKNKVVEYVTEENIGQFGLHDIILPLPGYHVLLPKNKVSDEYHRLLQKDGLSIPMLRHKVKDLALPGDYRQLVIKPEDVKWESLYYDDVQPLILSDLELLEKKSLTLSGSSKHKALKVELSLPPSSYATMALREVLRIDTSSHYQAQLNSNPHQKDQAPV